MVGVIFALVLLATEPAVCRAALWNRLITDLKVDEDFVTPRGKFPVEDVAGKPGNLDVRPPLVLGTVLVLI